MTNYLLPESDRLAADVNPVLTEIAAMDREAATAVMVGGLTVSGLFDESVSDLHEEVMAEALSQGVPQEVAETAFHTVIDGLLKYLSPRVEAVANATQAALERAAEAEVAGLIANLATSLFGDEGAAEFLASIEEEHDDCPVCADEDGDETPLFAAV